MDTQGDGLLWVVLAGILVWLGIGGYVAFIAIRQKSLALALKRLEQLRHDAP